MSYPLENIGSLGKVVTGKTPSKSVPEFWGGDIPFVSPSELGKGFPVTAAKVYVTEAGAQKVTVLPPNSILVCCIGSLGKIGIAGRELVTNQQINAIVFDENKVFYKYGFYACSLLQGHMENTASSTTVKIVNKTSFSELTIPVPKSVDEQKRIAAILDKADSLRKKAQQAISECDEFLKSTFLDMFGDPVRNPKDWPVIAMYELITDGPQNGLYKPSKDYGEGVPILRIDSFYTGAVTDIAALKRVKVTDIEKKRYALTNGDFVINRVNSRSHLGKSALITGITEDTVFESNMMRFQIDESKVNKVYLIQAMQKQFFKNQILGRAKDAVNQSSINQKDVLSFTVPQPDMPLQNKFAEIVKKTEEIKAKMQQQLDELDDNFNALMQRAFKGELWLI